ncbi:MAG: hypothetical protein IT258_12700 [Saprospiraceae bacterium]|nr:hypothetical protein [Saprospiraceae bacterium]
MKFRTKRSPSYFNHCFIEGGLGIFTATWPNKMNHKRLRMELFGGYGLGFTSINIGPSFFFNPTGIITHHEGRYHRKFLQPAIGLRGEKSEISLAVRITETNFSRFRDFSNGLATDGGAYNFTAIEPVFTWAKLFDNGRMFFQMGAVLPNNNSDYTKAAASGWAYSHITIGFVITQFRNRKQGQ